MYANSRNNNNILFCLRSRYDFGGPGASRRSLGAIVSQFGFERLFLLQSRICVHLFVQIRMLIFGIAFVAPSALILHILGSF